MRRIHCKLAVLMAEKDPRLTQTKLAADLGLGRTTINRYCNGRPLDARMDTSIIEKLLDYFDCELADLFEVRDEQ